MSVPVRRSPRQGRSAAKVEAVLAAAREILATGGSGALSARALADRAGVTVPTVYRYFSSIDEVVDVVLEEHAAAAAEAVDIALAGTSATTVEQVFRAVLDAHLVLYRERPELTVVAADPVLAERRRRIDEAVDRELARRVGEHLVALGLLPRLTPTLVRRLEAHWATVGALLGCLLGAEGRARTDLAVELDALVAHVAARY